MFRGTTPVLNFGLPFKTDKINLCFITFVQSGVTKLEKTISDVELTQNSINLQLTQEETLIFNAAAPVEIQIRIKMNDGSALASNIIRTAAERILKDGQI